MHLMMRPPSPQRKREETQIDPSVFSSFKQAKEAKIQVQAPPPKPKRQNPAQKFAQELQTEDPAPKAKKPPPKSSKSVSSYKNSTNKQNDKPTSSTSKSGESDASSSSNLFTGVSFNKKAQQSDSTKPKQPNNNVNKPNTTSSNNSQKISNNANNKPANNTAPKNSSNSNNGKLVIGDALKKPSTTSAATSVSKPTNNSTSNNNTASKNNNAAKSNTLKYNSAQGSINGIKLGLNVPSKDKLKEVEDTEKELQRKLAEVQRIKQQLAGGSASSNTQQQRSSSTASGGGQNRARSVPMPIHLMTPAQRAAMQSNADSNNKSIFRSPYNDQYSGHPGRRAAPEYEESYEEDSFVASEEASDVEEDFYEEDWKKALRSVTKYDPRKYYDDGDDKDMEAGFDEIEHEERRSTWLGRKEDAEEERKERERALRKAGKLPPAPSSSSAEKRKQVDGGHKNQGPPVKKPRTGSNNDYVQNQLARAVPGQLNIGSGVRPGAGTANAQQVRKPQINTKKNDDPFF